MTKYLSMFRLVSIAIIIVVLGALFGWYYFLAGKNTQSATQSAGAGYGNTVPTFEGSTGSTYANTISTLGQTPNVTFASTTSRLWEVSAVPVAGFGWQKTSSTLYFVERSSGYVFEATVQPPSVLRLTDTLTPKIYTAQITADGSVLERSVDNTGVLITFTGVVATSSAGVPAGAATSSHADLVGADLPQGIGGIVADANSDTLFYTIPTPTGVSLVSTNFSGEKEKSLFSSVITGWHLIAPGDGTLVLLQSPLDSASGYAYKLQKNGSLSLVAQAPGLTVLPHASSTMLLIGTSLNGTLSLFAQSSATAPAEQLSIRTIADKCAWTPGVGPIAYCAVPQTVSSQQFLNDWYKGLVHTSDTFYAVDVSDASTTLFYDPTTDTNTPLDVEDPSVDPSGQYLAFINAKDQSLWILRIAP